MAQSIANKRSRLKIPPTLGFSAGFAAFAIVVYAIAGGVWAFWRPTMQGIVEEQGVRVVSGAEAQADTYFSFAALTAVLALPLAMWFFYRFPSLRKGYFLVWWAGIFNGIGAIAFYLAGAGVVSYLHPMPHGEKLANAVGDSIELAPNFSPGIALALAPLIATFVVWSAVFVYLPEEDAGDEVNISKM